MCDNQIKHIRIAIIQFLRDKDPMYNEIPLGANLYKEVKVIEGEDPMYSVTYDEADNKAQFLKDLDDISDSIKEPTLLTLHIVTHGCEGGIGIDGGQNFIPWKELYDHIRPINIKLHNTLMLVMSVCVGAGIMTRLNPRDRAPFMAFIANTRSVTFNDAAKGFPLFYRKYRNPVDFPEALKSLNNAIDFDEPLEDGRRKTEFFAYSSKEMFEQVMNPDRDPDNFKKIALSLKYSDPTLTDDEKILIAREMIIREADKFRSHFNCYDLFQTK